MKITYPEVGTPEYIINEKLSYEDARIISNHIAAITAENAKLREALNDILDAPDYMTGEIAREALKATK